MARQLDFGYIKRGVESLFNFFSFYLLIKSYNNIYSTFTITNLSFIQMTSILFNSRRHQFYHLCIFFIKGVKEEKNRRQYCYYLWIILAKFFFCFFYTFLVTNFTYAVQYPEVHHRTSGSTSVLNQFSSVQCCLLDTEGKFYKYTNIL